MRLTIEKAIDVLKDYYKKALRSDFVEKPISSALYQTWRKFNAIEKDRHKEANNET